MRYNIYVYELKDGKHLLYPVNNDDFGINECSFVYQEIVRNNPIVRVVHVQEGVESWQIDAYVHVHMRKYGVENVRGGRYNTRELSESAKNEISEAIKFFSYGLEEQAQRVCQYYDCRESIPHDTDYYRDCIKKYEELDGERKKYTIDRTIAYDLNWLKRIVEKGNNKFFDIKPKYDTLMNRVAAVYDQYLKSVEDAQEKIDSIHKLYEDCAKCELFFQKPYVFFDARIIQEERDHNDYKYECDVQFRCVFSILELAIYSLINREDELIFDLSQIDIQEHRDKLFILGERSFASLNPITPPSQ